MAGRYCNPNRTWLLDGRRMVVLLLCLGAWRGPVPVFHEHGVGAQLAPHLAEHCRAFHSDIHQATFLGWHFHLVCPWCLGAEPASGDGTHADPLTSGQALVANGESLSPRDVDTVSHYDAAHLVCCLSARVSPSPTTAGLTLAVERGQSFTTRLLITAPLPALFGLARC